MLDTLRKNSRSVAIYIIFGSIIGVFVFSFGPSSGGCRSTGQVMERYAAVVNGEEIPVADFDIRFAEMLSFMRRYDKDIDSDSARVEGIKRDVLDRLISQHLVAQAAKRNGIAVSDEELAKKIQKSLGFDEKNKFDEKLYRDHVQMRLGMSIWQYEEQERAQMAADKMITGVLQSIKVSDDEVKAAYVLANEKMDLAFVRFSPVYYKSEDKTAKPDAAAVDNFLKANATRIGDFYKASSFRYNKPQRVKARHILVKLDPNPTEASVQRAKNKLLDLKKKIAAGGDFAAEAKASTEDAATKENGGDLGVFGPGTMDPAFEKAAFALKAGEVSEPVRSSFGFHLIKAEEIIPAENKQLKDVEREIAAELIVDDAAKAIAKKHAEETLAKLGQGKKLAELWPPAEKKEGETAQSPVGGKPQTDYTGDFSPVGKSVPRLGFDPAFIAAATKLDEKKPTLDKVYELSGDFVVVELKSRSRADMKDFEAKASELRQKVRDEKSREAVESFVSSLKAGAKIEKNQGLFSDKRRAVAAVDDEG